MKKRRSFAFFVLSLLATCSLSAKTLQEYANKNTIKVIKYNESNVKKYDEGDLSIGAMGLADFMIDLSEKDLTDLEGISRLKVKDIKGKKKSITDIDNLLLYLERNELTHLPAEIGEMTNVTVIFVKKNQLIELPDEITLLKDLKAIYIDDNSIKEFPSQFFDFAAFEKPALIKIGLSDNKISSLPQNIGDLSPLPLYHFNLADNQIKVVPPSIGNLKKLRVLHLDGNQISKIPDEIGNLSGLINKLYLNDNFLTSVPDSLSKLPVERIYLQNNRLTSIPKSFGKFKALREINLSENELTTLPEELANIDSLRKIDLRDNPIKSLPSKLKNNDDIDIILDD